jgi:hypothetical protein
MSKLLVLQNSNKVKWKINLYAKYNYIFLFVCMLYFSVNDNYIISNSVAFLLL